MEIFFTEQLRVLRSAYKMDFGRYGDCCMLARPATCGLSPTYSQSDEKILEYKTIIISSIHLDIRDSNCIKSGRLNRNTGLQGFRPKVGRSRTTQKTVFVNAD